VAEEESAAMTDCRNCKTEIKKTMMGWVHVVSGLFRCHKVPTPDPQLYAEPVYEIDRLAESKAGKVKMRIMFDGLVSIAAKHGLSSYSTDFIGPGEDGYTCVAQLHWANGTQEIRQSLKDAKEDGTGTSRIWEMYPAMMLAKFTVSKGIRDRLKDQLKELEGE
jgi:hypothetical protein